PSVVLYGQTYLGSDSRHPNHPAADVLPELTVQELPRPTGRSFKLDLPVWILPNQMLRQGPPVSLPRLPQDLLDPNFQHRLLRQVPSRLYSDPQEPRYRWRVG